MQYIELERLPDGTLFSKEDQPKVDEWVAGLRSGKFEQGQVTLYSKKNARETLCCMGVLEHVVNGVELKHMESLCMPSDLKLSFKGYEPVKLRNKYAQYLKAILTTRKQNSESTTSTMPQHWNDLLRMNFHQIADLLEGKRVRVIGDNPWT